MVGRIVKFPMATTMAFRHSGSVSWLLPLLLLQDRRAYVWPTHDLYAGVRCGGEVGRNANPAAARMARTNSPPSFQPVSIQCQFSVHPPTKRAKLCQKIYMHKHVDSYGEVRLRNSSKRLYQWIMLRHVGRIATDMGGGMGGRGGEGGRL